jgi:hypothetical protein
MRAILPIVFGILLILFTTFDDNSVRYNTCENTNMVRYDVVENFSKTKKIFGSVAEPLLASIGGGLVPPPLK